MAETSTASIPSSKNIGKVLQRTVTRTKEKVLRNIGKADQTIDDAFEKNVNNFTEQQNVALKFQKELKNYSNCLKEMASANNSLNKTLKEVFESDWTGYTEFCAAQENMPDLWADYLNRLNDEVSTPLNSYISQFPEIKAKISKRNRKLTDYDSARHNHEAASKKQDEIKVHKCLEEMNEAKHVYESINTELHDELPNFYNSRVPVLSSLIASLSSLEILFQTESAKLKSAMEAAAIKLNEEDVDYRPRLISENRPIRVESMGEEVIISHSPVANKNNNSHSNPKKIITVNNPKISTTDESSGAGDIHIVQQQESHAQESHAQESHAAAVTFLFKQDEKENNIKTPNGNREVESLMKVHEINNDCQQSESDHGGFPRILYRVQAVHEYTGDDIDELSFENGDIINVVPFDDPEEQDDGWLMGIKETTKKKKVPTATLR